MIDRTIRVDITQLYLNRVVFEALHLCPMPTMVHTVEGSTVFLLLPRDGVVWLAALIGRLKVSHQTDNDTVER